jgi:hypothetical protein
MTSWDTDPFGAPRGYRPYHDPGGKKRPPCPARDPNVPVSRLTLDDDGYVVTVMICTCGGLDKPAWEPGDVPAGASR